MSRATSGDIAWATIAGSAPRRPDRRLKGRSFLVSARTVVTANVPRSTLTERQKDLAKQGL
jgi:hypothetical protein